MRNKILFLLSIGLSLLGSSKGDTTLVPNQCPPCQYSGGSIIWNLTNALGGNSGNSGQCPDGYTKNATMYLIVIPVCCCNAPTATSTVATKKRVVRQITIAPSGTTSTTTLAPSKATTGTTYRNLIKLCELWDDIRTKDLRTK